MSDFRVPVVSAAEDLEYDQELDWDRTEKTWTLSDREVGLGKSWVLGRTPSPEQLESLLDFFRIAPGQIQTDVLARLSPGELALVHRNTTDTVSVYAVLCDKCRQHWYVFRWEQDKNRWGAYGRTCDFSWRRGWELNEGEVAMLMRARGLSDNPFRPPE